MRDDAELLRQFHLSGSEDALSELVRRHLDLVYACALRCLNGNTHQASDVTQQVFSTLVRHAGSLGSQRSLVAWLHTAARNASIDLIKKEQRRRRHESEAAAMGNQSSDTDALSPADLARLRGLLDDLLAALPARDREALLLRHLQGHDFSTIAEVQQATPDAARMRVNRALTRLREALARRGIQSSATALASALAAEAAIQAPTSLASSLTTASLAAVPALGTGLVFKSLLLMNGSKIASVSLGSLALLCGTATLYEYARAASLQASLASARTENAELSNEIARLTEENRQLASRQKSSASDLNTLQSQLASAAKEADEITDDLLRERRNEASLLVRQKRYKEALEIYKWLYEKGYPSSQMMRMMGTALLSRELKQLAELYEPARNYLQNRRNELRDTYDLNNFTNLYEFMRLNTALNESAVNIAFYDALPADDKRRRQVAMFCMEAFASLGRYQDAALSWKASQSEQDYQLYRDQLSTLTDDSAKARAIRNYATTVTREIEILAGSGNLPRAQSLIARFTADTALGSALPQLQAALARAGHPELLTEAQSK